MTIRIGHFELKHDGFRSLAYIEGGRCRLVSRHRNVYKSFETLREALAGLKAKSAILDGEIVALDSNGVSQLGSCSSRKFVSGILRGSWRSERRARTRSTDG